jgi:hypothetical protein
MAEAKKSRVSASITFLALIAAIVLCWLGRVTYDYFDPNGPANLAMQAQLKMFGNAIYEYHSRLARWPSTIDDFAQTSVPMRSHGWRQTANTIVFLWRQDLKPKPEDNSGVLLAYWRGGLYNRFGRVWVCWGDLHTEHLKQSELTSALRN